MSWLLQRQKLMDPVGRFLVNRLMNLLCNPEPIVFQVQFRSVLGNVHA